MSLAALVVKMLDEDRRATERLLGEVGMVNLLTRLELLGRGALDERLVKICGRIVTHLQKLPVYEQKRLLDEGVPVVLADKPDEHLMVDVQSLWPAQLKQVFGLNGVRSLAEQRAWLEEKKLCVLTARQLPAYQVHGTTVKIGAVELDILELARQALGRKDLERLLRDCGGAV